MRFVVFIVLAIPYSIALQCISSGTENGTGGEQQKTCADSAKFCYTLDQSLNGTQIQQKGCSDNSTCSDVGTFDRPDLNGTVTCCTTELCNPAAPVSLLITVLAAAAAACWI
ncbi:hypothetical protein PENTCL1PPCAC_15316 [Pristionchus entomophagus]|uniref:UPAR/Ly6 domain-containing protein n=1 Tax=Pristionchus entomophagus TaxID=358040 RepID=A0AAV5TGY1_9BILA|nr:hypothetical protein PENTCL1PPCAC_15316 [Pristionchus entomophagus]